MILHIHNQEEPEYLSVFPADPGQEVIPPKKVGALPAQLHGRQPPKVEIQKETATHRTAAFMVASGAKLKTVAFELGVAESTVSNWLRQPWFQANVNSIIQEEFGGDLTAMLKSFASTALLVQVDLMTNSTSDAVRLKAASDLLDRFRGKPTTFVHHTNSQLSEDPQKEILRLEEELKLSPSAENNQTT